MNNLCEFLKLISLWQWNLCADCQFYFYQFFSYQHDLEMSEKSYVCSWTRRIRECLKEYVCTCTCIQFKSFSLLLWVYKWPWCVTISYCLGCSFQRYPEMFRFLLMEGLLSIYIFLWSGNILEWYHAIIAREDNSALLRILAALSRKRTFLFLLYYQLFWLIVLIIFFFWLYTQ